MSGRRNRRRHVQSEKKEDVSSSDFEKKEVVAPDSESVAQTELLPPSQTPSEIVPTPTNPSQVDPCQTPLPVDDDEESDHLAAAMTALRLTTEETKATVIVEPEAPPSNHSADTIDTTHTAAAHVVDNHDSNNTNNDEVEQPSNGIRKRIRDHVDVEPFLELSTEKDSNVKTKRQGRRRFAPHVCRNGARCAANRAASEQLSPKTVSPTQTSSELSTPIIAQPPPTLEISQVPTEQLPPTVPPDAVIQPPAVAEIQIPPAAVSEPTPATVSEPTPATVSEPTPATVSEPTPATVIDPTPAAVIEPIPAAVIDSRPATLIEPIAVQRSTAVLENHSPTFVAQQPQIATAAADIMATPARPPNTVIIHERTWEKNQQEAIEARKARHVRFVEEQKETQPPEKLSAVVPPPWELNTRPKPNGKTQVIIRINTPQLTDEDLRGCAKRYVEVLEKAGFHSLEVFYNASKVEAIWATSMIGTIRDVLVPLRPLLEAKLALYAACIPYPNVISAAQLVLKAFPSVVPGQFFATEKECAEYLRKNGTK